MNELNELTAWIMDFLPGFVAALAILIIGWLVARVLSSAARRGVNRTKLGETLADWLKGEDDARHMEADKWAGNIVYYLVMFFVLIAFFQSLGLTFIAEPLTGFLNEIFQYLPRIFGAAVLLLVAWIVATLLKMLIIKVLGAAKIDERLGEELEEEKKGSMVQNLANIVYWLVFLFFLPAILTTLALEGLLVPVQNMLELILSYIPNIFGAAIIILIGWIGARILQRLVVKFLDAVGIDKISDKAGVTEVMGEHKLSGLVGILVYTLVLIFAIIAALNALAVEAITVPASNMLDMILGALPAILAAALVLGIAYLIGKIIAALVTNILAAAGFNNILSKVGLSQVSMEGKKSPSEIVGYLVLVAVMLFAAIEASGLLGFAMVADLISSLLVILAQVAVGVVIFGIGLYLAGVAHETVLASGGPQSNLLARLAKVAIIVLAGFMALSQMGVAEEIIIIGFGILLGAIALTAVVAFGIGGRDLAARELEEWIKDFKSKE